jgi:hypothetical protein
MKAGIQATQALALQAAADHIRALPLPAPAEAEWRPIEMAPRDGEVLARSPAYGGITVIAIWDDDRHARKPRPFWRFTGHDITTARAAPPTHWRPLPPPPLNPER